MIRGPLEIQRGPRAELRYGGWGQSPPEAETFSVNFTLILDFFKHAVTSI